MTTVGALKRKGWHGLEVYCRPCHSVHVLIWAYLRQPDGMEINAVIARLRHRKCGNRPEPADVSPYHLDTATADGSGSPDRNKAATTTTSRPTSS